VVAIVVVVALTRRHGYRVVAGFALNDVDSGGELKAAVELKSGGTTIANYFA
jgi:hypothetical protein